MKKEARWLLGTALVVFAASAAGVNYYLRGQEAQKKEEAAKQPAPETSLLVRPHSRSLGPADAKVTVVEFLDPECESCRAIYPVVKHLLGQYPGKVRLVVRYMPFHPNSYYAASALESAGAQGRYWEMLDVLFQNQPQWGDHHQPRPELITGYAQQIGLGMTDFERLLNSAEHKKIVDDDRSDGQKLGVQGTPTFFVNGRRLERLAYEGLKALIDEELAK